MCTGIITKHRSVTFNQRPQKGVCVCSCLGFRFLSYQDLMYMSDKPNYSLIHTVLESLQLELRLLVDPPDGTKEHPAATCLELWLCHPEFTSGQSHFQLLCFLTHKTDLYVTCLHSLRVFSLPA